jgi:hypothetical protein
VCVTIILLGAGNLLNGRLGYFNYKGFYVFAPFAIFAGLLGSIAAFRVKSSSQATPKRGRIRGCRPPKPATPENRIRA